MFVLTWTLEDPDYDSGERVIAVSVDPSLLMSYAQTDENDEAEDTDRDAVTLNWAEIREGSNNWTSNNVFERVESHYSIYPVEVI